MNTALRRLRELEDMLDKFQEDINYYINELRQEMRDARDEAAQKEDTRPSAITSYGIERHKE